MIVIGLDRLGYHYSACVVAAFLTTTVIGYLLHTAYTFRLPPSRVALLRFSAASLTGFWLSMLVMTLLCAGAGFSATVAMPIATVLLFVWNFASAH